MVVGVVPPACSTRDSRRRAAPEEKFTSNVHNSMDNFYREVPPMEVYRASVENEVGLPAFATEKGSS